MLAGLPLLIYTLFNHVDYDTLNFFAETNVHEGEAALRSGMFAESAAKHLAHSKRWFTMTSDMQPTSDLEP
jgi:hypothetical protein